MNKFLPLLSSVGFFTMTSNTISTINIDANSNLKQQTISNDTTTLFNNKFNFLNKEKWITNQSKSDDNFYSYDVSYANFKLSNGIDARTIFSVDDSGQLQFDEKLVPNPDLNNIKNILEEIKSHKEVTNIKSHYNGYSKSVYSTSYFSGAGSNWQYIQQGGSQKNIDISNQQSANKVEHNNNLSEALGLYYIAKAVRTEGGIDERVGIDLAKYFIAQSSLQQTNGTGINDDLIIKMLDLIVANNNIYSFIYQTPMNVNNKNYSMNYIFDSSNNLIEIYYNKWTNTDNYQHSVGINYSDSFNGTGSYFGYGSETKIIFDFWADYANDWNDFAGMFPTFSFDNKSALSVSSQYDHKILQAMSGNTVDIKGTFTCFFYLEITHDGGFFGAYDDLSIGVYLWHDDHNVYCYVRMYEKSTWATESCALSLALNSITFNNVMH